MMEMIEGGGPNIVKSNPTCIPTLLLSKSKVACTLWLGGDPPLGEGVQASQDLVPK